MNATTLRDFLNNEGSTIISIEFTKKNGEKRVIQFNPRDRKEIKGFGVKSNNPDILRVRDFAIARSHGTGAWRSLNIQSISKIVSRGRIYTF
jgi:hypothetical protein